MLLSRKCSSCHNVALKAPGGKLRTRHCVYSRRKPTEAPRHPEVTDFLVTSNSVAEKNARSGAKSRKLRFKVQLSFQTEVSPIWRNLGADLYDDLRTHRENMLNGGYVSTWTSDFELIRAKMMT